MTTPSDYGLPFDSLRPGQAEKIESLLKKRDGSVTILSAATGAGKSAICRGVGSKFGVTAVVRTKLLQYGVYSGYDFDVMTGKSNHLCCHPERQEIDTTAAECMYEPKMDECNYENICSYLVAKRIVQKSNLRVLNTAYFLSAGWPRLSRYATPYLFLDEAHLLADETVEWTGLTVREMDRIKNRLPEFPTCYQSSRENVYKVREWMEKSVGILMTAKSKFVGKDADTLAKKSRVERLIGKLSVTCAAIELAEQDWYVRSGVRAIEYMGQPRPGLMARPLTARHHFPKLFLGVYPRVVMMSATIGAPEFFAEELGLGETWEYEQVPNQWPASSRPVHVLDCPNIGYKSPESDLVKQAEVIVRALGALPGDWGGIIHVTSWNQATGLSQRLARAGFDSSRLFVPTRGQGTNEQLSEWDRVKMQKSGMVVITPSMSEGVDLLAERISIVAKVPFPSISPGSYDQERMLYSNNLYRLRTAWGLEQRCGRTRRGRPEDYDTAGQINGYVAIADGSFEAKRVGIKKYCSRDFTESLVYD